MFFFPPPFSAGADEFPWGVCPGCRWGGAAAAAWGPRIVAAECLKLAGKRLENVYFFTFPTQFTNSCGYLTALGPRFHPPHQPVKRGRCPGAGRWARLWVPWQKTLHKRLGFCALWVQGQGKAASLRFFVLLFWAGGSQRGSLPVRKRWEQIVEAARNFPETLNWGGGRCFAPPVTPGWPSVFYF